MSRRDKEELEKDVEINNDSEYKCTFIDYEADESDMENDEVPDGPTAESALSRNIPNLALFSGSQGINNSADEEAKQYPSNKDGDEHCSKEETPQLCPNNESMQHGSLCESGEVSIGAIKF